MPTEIRTRLSSSELVVAGRMKAIMISHRMRLAEYLERIGVSGRVAPTADTLRRVHLAHRETFLFENLTIQTGGRISITVDDLERKFLDERRGGYCFEHNTIFAAALVDLGFAPVTLLGRVRRGPPDRWCRTHMVLKVQGAGVQGAGVHGAGVQGATCWLADVGFGGLGLLEPIELREGATSLQGGLEYSLRRDDRLWVLAMRDASGETMDLYEFSEDPQTPWDVEVANHFTATHPESIFRRTLTIQRSSHDERIILRGDVLARYRNGVLTEDAVERSQLSRLARELFQVDLPPGPFVFEGSPALSTPPRSRPDTSAAVR
jgi:N-hydroxyarylamine O-acetyltransferase